MVAHDLRDTLKECRAHFGGGRGISAPQIGAPIRMIYVEMDRPWLLCNPEIIDVGTDDFLVWDDCFSFPNLMVQVQRAHRVKVRYQDAKGEDLILEAHGELAELLQHEIDHLDGVLAVDRPAGVDPFCIREEWERHYANTGRYSEPVTRPEPVGSP
jgi:peptide deformylase